MLEEKDLVRLREIFVTRDTCDEKKHANEIHIQKLEISMARVSTKMTVMIGILGAIGVAILSVVVKMMFGG